MQNMPQYCDKIKTSKLIEDIGALDISATAKYIATVMHTIAVVDVAELSKITGLERRTIQRAKADYAAASGNDTRDTRDNGVKNDATIATIASNLTFADDNRVKFDVLPVIAPTCADIASHANKESSSKILLPSEVKKESEVSEVFVSPKAQPKTKVDRGSRLQNDFVVPADWIDWTRTNCPGSTAETAAVEALKFTNYWTALAGAKARKTDWKKTWQNWSMTAFSRAPLRPAVAVGSGQAPWVEEKLKRQRETMQWAREAGLIS